MLPDVYFHLHTYPHTAVTKPARLARPYWHGAAAAVLLLLGTRAPGSCVVGWPVRTALSRGAGGAGLSCCH